MDEGRNFRAALLMMLLAAIVVAGVLAYGAGYNAGRNEALATRPIQQAWHECQEFGGNWISFHQLDGTAADITCAWRAE